jgi:hypothetical protein
VNKAGAISGCRQKNEIAQFSGQMVEITQRPFLHHTVELTHTLPVSPTVEWKSTMHFNGKKGSFVRENSHLSHP